MISVDQYWMGRDQQFPVALSPAIKRNAQVLVGLVNALLDEAAADGVRPGKDTRTGTAVASGWRPPEINDATSNAATGSTHLTGEGADLRDADDRQLARWCLRNLAVLERLGLWMEDPQWTPSWVHLQSKPPRSSRRVFVPSNKPPLVAKLPEQR